MREQHPFKAFCPEKCEYLLLGTFVGKIDKNYDWFYMSRRNQFWEIMGKVYGVDLNTKDKKQELLANLKMAITDVILSCEREENNNADTNLTGIEFNKKAINKIIKDNKLKVIYFSSQWAKKLFEKEFKKTTKAYPEIKLVTLPSPSPRCARMNKEEKIKIYRNLLPKLVKV